jgi:pimeloyl-ACP methyl ester carboxylesterase
MTALRESSQSRNGRLPRRLRAEIARHYPSQARPAFPWEATRAGEDYGRPATPDWRDIDWQDYLRECEVAGRRMRYVELGSGDPPVVFVHGLGGNWQNWLENLPAAARHRRTIAMDLPGFGESEMPDGEISISNYADWVAELLDAVGGERAVVVGNSMGGFVVCELAIAHPKRVSGLVLCASAGISATNVRRHPLMTFVRAGTAIASWVSANSHLVAARPRSRHLATAMVFRHPSRLPADLTAEVMKGAGKPAFMQGLEACLSYDFRDRLNEIECPTLIVWGAEDVIVPSQDADEFNRHIPHARKVVFDETGHCPMLERPREFNRCLVEFLGDEPAGEDRETVRTASSDGGGRDAER